jgi:ABC-type oligopeptide transport system substrate-binding subunit
MLVLGISLLGGTYGYAGHTGRDVKGGGTFRVLAIARDFDSIDPAISYTITSSSLLDPVCARLFNYPDRSGKAGLRLTPEVAEGLPGVSRDGRTYTFTVRKGLRFSNGAPVEANAFARAINRTLNPAMRSPGAQYVDEIVGAENVLAGRATSARGIRAKGRRLTVKLTQPVPDFPARMTMLFFCAVPPLLRRPARARATARARPESLLPREAAAARSTLRRRFHRQSG